ncbi:hypothetical protein C8F01DRAFT_1266694 [Mycena amicta]|nr:hypothetical protein C8F01DRAFT_1266694 [Mycena amicta]
MSEPVTIIIGDHSFDTHSTNPPGGWYPEDDWFPSVFNDSTFVPDPVALGEGSPWVFGLDGVSISLFGVSPPVLPAYNQTIAISNPLDPKANSTDLSSYTPYKYPSPALGGQLLTTGRLFEVGEFTSLDGMTILLDDSSQEIEWNGGWSVKSDYGTTLQVGCELPVLPHDPNNNTTIPFTATMVPHGNSTHVSSAKGDLFTFPFAGTSLSIYGVPPGPANDENWQFKMQFSIDGTNNSTATFTASQFTVYAPHFLYYTVGALTPGNHTLTATVVEAAGSANPAAQIDYLVYTPTFATIHDKPVFPASSGVASGASPSISSSASPPLSSLSPSTGGDGGFTAKSKHSKAGPIAGGVVGGVILLVVLAVLLLWLRRRKRKKDVVVPPVNYTHEPFTNMPSVHRDESFVSRPFSPLRNLSPSSAPSSSFIIPSQKSQTLAQQRDELAEEIRRLGLAGGAGESPSVTANANTTVSGNPVQLEAGLRELQNQMEVLTREMRYQQMVPPEYEEAGGVGG